jgi:hypothetical protein
MLAFTRLSTLSTLEEELERLRLEVWFVAMLPLRRLSALSTLDEELEKIRLEV